MKGKGFLKTLLLIFLLVFFAYQIFSALYQPFTTAAASYYETYNGIKSNALIVRNEKLVTSDISGIKQFVVKNGEKVSKSGTIANVYENESVSGVYAQIESLETQLEALQSLSSSANGTADLTVINTKIENKTAEIKAAAAKGKYDEAEELNTELFSLLSSKNNIVDGKSDVDSLITQIKAKINSLKSGVPSANNKITADISGFFVNEADGYESVLTTENIENITPTEFKNLKPKEVDKNVIGKLVSDYTWYFAAEFDANDALKLKEGNNYNVITGENLGKEITINLVSLNSDNTDKTVAVFSCDEADGDFSCLRRIPITVVLEKYEGLKVSNRSVRMVDNNLGVYVVSAGIIKFKKITSVYSNDEFTVCKIDKTGNSECLRLYDEVVDKGKNLYDGKLVN